MKLQAFVLGLVMSSSLMGQAGDDFSMDEVKNAIPDVQKQMNDPEARKQMQNQDAKSRDLADKVKSFSSDAGNEDDIYRLAAEMLPVFMEMSGNDPSKTGELAEELKRNPTSFAKKMTPAQRAKLSEIAKKIEAKNKTTP